MPDVYDVPSFFSDDPRTGALSYEQLVARQKIAAALATRNRPYPKTIGEGLSALGEGLGEGYAFSRAAADEKAYRQQSDALVRRLSGADASQAPAAATAAAPPAAPDTGPASVYDPVGGGVAGNVPVTNQLSAKAQAPQQSSLLWKQIPEKPDMTIEEFNQRTARNESGGEKDPYRAIGREVSRRGDRAYGKYQVMGENIPVWTKQYLGREMTPQEFLWDDKAQDQLAKAKGGEYLAKYGPNGAAAAWFAGENGMKDQSRPNLQTHIADYVTKFNRPAPSVERDQVAASAARAPVDPENAAPIQVASLGGMPTPDTGRDAMAQSLAGPPPSPPQQPVAPPPVQVAQQQQLPIGRPPPTPPPEVVPRYTAPTAPQGPPTMPDQTPMSAREMEIRRAIGATTDPTLKGRLEPLADRMEAERKFKDTQNMELWKKDIAAWEKRTDPLQQQQLQKLQEESAQRARELRKDQERGGVSQAFIDKGLEESAKTAVPLRAASHSLNEIEDLLNAGMFTGTLSKAELAAAKLKHSLGFPLDPRIANTERFTAAVAPITAAARSALVGNAQISNADLAASEKASGGNITLDAESIKGIMKNLRVIQAQTALYHQGLLENSSRGNPQAEATLYGMYGLPMENIVPRASPAAVERLMKNADNEHERDLFNKAFHTPGLAEKIILRNRQQ